jgi:hypothetical protein
MQRYVTFTRETESEGPSASTSINVSIPGKGTAALAPTKVIEHILKLISEDLQILKWSNNKNND